VSAAEVRPAHPLAAIAAPGQHGAPGTPGLRITLPQRDIVQVTARRGHETALADAARTALGLDLPPPGAAAQADGIAALWTQPHAWTLLVPRGAEGGFAARITDTLGPHACIVDLTHGRAVLAIAGPAARAVLAKGCALDLHPRAFLPGRAAGTLIAHLNAQLHRPQGPADTYEILVASTLARPMFEWLLAAGAEFGIEVA